MNLLTKHFGTELKCAQYGVKKGTPAFLADFFNERPSIISRGNLNDYVTQTTFRYAPHFSQN